MRLSKLRADAPRPRPNHLGWERAPLPTGLTAGTPPIASLWWESCQRRERRALRSVRKRCRDTCVSPPNLRHS
jgi:hypothetical protein